MALTYNTIHWGNYLREELKKRKLTQKKFADMLKKHPDAIRKMLSRSQPSLSNLRQVSKVLNDDLLVKLLANESKASWDKANQDARERESIITSQVKVEKEKMDLERERQLALKDAEIARLKAEMLELKHEKDLEISALRAKLEVHESKN